MSLVKCRECNNDISDQATSCPHCGCPINPENKTLVQMDTAPHKRRKYKVRMLIFAPMFILGVVLTLGSILSGEGQKIALWSLVGVIGFVGMIVSVIGYWLAEP